MTQTATKKSVIEMTDTEFAAQIAQQHAALDRIEAGVRELKAEYDSLGRRLAGLQPN